MRTKVDFVPREIKYSLVNCPSVINIATNITFRIQRDNSYHNSVIKYRRLDIDKDEEFTFNTGKDTDHTNVQFDGYSLTCKGNGKGDNQCNNLPDGKPVPVVMYQIDFNPRDGGFQHWNKGEWRRQKYTLLGNYYVAKCKGMSLV